jgi:hypothetical protein
MQRDKVKLRIEARSSRGSRQRVSGVIDRYTILADTCYLSESQLKRITRGVLQDAQHPLRPDGLRPFAYGNVSGRRIAAKRPSQSEHGVVESARGSTGQPRVVKARFTGAYQPLRRDTMSGCQTRCVGSQSAVSALSAERAPAALVQLRERTSALDQVRSGIQYQG